MEMGSGKSGLVVGTDGQSRYLCDVLVHRRGWKVPGFVGDRSGELMDRPVYGLDDPGSIPPDVGLVLGWSDPARREEAAGRLGRERFLTVLEGPCSPYARIGVGCVALGGVIAESWIGDFVFLAESAIPGHHCWVGDYSVLGLKYCGGGGSRVGRRVWAGVRVSVAPKVEIGDDAWIGAGSVVTRGVASGTAVAGHPARVVGQVGGVPSVTAAGR
jgi:hypothetical protein